MKMGRFLALTLASMAFDAGAHGTLGEALDAGGRILSEDEFRKRVVGTRLSGPGRGGGEVDILYEPSGQFSGSVVNRGTPSGLYGPWKVEASGRVCVDLTNARSGTREMSCGYFVGVGDAIYHSRSSDDRAETLVRRAPK